MRILKDIIEIVEDDDDDDVIPIDFMVDNSDDFITIGQKCIAIPELGIKFSEGIYYTIDELDNPQVCCCLTVIYDIDETDASKYLYFEEGEQMSAIRNYLNIIGKELPLELLNNLEINFDTQLQITNEC